VELLRNIASYSGRIRTYSWLSIQITLRKYTYLIGQDNGCRAGRTFSVCPDRLDYNMHEG
jgi:hypothetical protein